MQALISITGVLMNDQKREVGIVPYQKFTEFINFLCERSRLECQGRYSDNMGLPEMSPRVIHYASTLNQVFICLATCKEGMPDLLIS